MTKETKLPVPAWAAGWNFSVRSGASGQRAQLEAEQVAVVRFPGDEERRKDWSDRTGNPPGEWPRDHVRLQVSARFIEYPAGEEDRWSMTVSGEREGLTSTVSALVLHSAPKRDVERILRRLLLSVGNVMESAARAAVPAAKP